MDRMFKGQVSLTEGSVARGMLVFAIPIFFSNLFQQLYNAVDSLIVGNFLGGNALAAVGSSGSLIFLLTGFVNGVSLGAGVLIARHYGAKDSEALKRTVHTTVALGIAASVALTVLGVILTPQILRWMGTPEDVFVNSVVYFRVYFLGSTAVVLYNIGASILQSVGNSRSPMYYLIAASLLNVVLDLLFVGVFHYGVGAAALATIISQAASAFLAFRKLTLSQEDYGVRWRQVRFHAATLRAVVAQGVPSGVQNSVISLANVIVQANINSFGAQAMAGCGAYSKIEGFAFLPVTCFSMALATFVSQNIGAAKLDRVRKGMRFGLITSPLLAEGIGLAIFGLAPLLIGAFNNEPDVVAFGVQQARTVALFYCLLAFSHCCAGILRGLGRPTVPMVVMLAVWCALRITYITVVLRLIPDIGVIFWAYPLTWSISSALFAWYLAHCPLPVPGGGAQARQNLH
nr:MATE family efflux transporter [Gemmiger gallinarum]